MNTTNKILFFIFIFGFLLAVIGTYLKINELDYSNLVLASGMILNSSMIVALIVYNFSKLTKLLR